MPATPLRTPLRSGQIRCHLASLLFGTSLLFLVTVLAFIAAHKQLRSWETASGHSSFNERNLDARNWSRLHCQSGPVWTSTAEYFAEEAPKFVYHSFVDSTGHRTTPMPRVLPAPSPPPPTPVPPPPPKASDFVKPALPARLAGMNHRPAAEVLKHGQMLSEEAYVASKRQHPEIVFDPPGGPLHKIVPPTGNSSTASQPGKYHVVVTADCGKYGRWQTLVNYYSYLKVKAEHPESALGGYTRILHCSRADDVLHVVPTLVVEHLPTGIDRGYGPMHRPWAFSQWLSRVNIPEEYIFMTEPDHVFVSPPPLVATPTSPAAFPFFYVDCNAAQWKPHCDNPLFNEREVHADDVPRTGNSPTMISKSMMLEMLPRWDRTVRAIHANLEADKALGWAQEMFAFSLALANNPSGPTEVSYHQEFMAQPPFDRILTYDKCQASVLKPASKTKGEECELSGTSRYVNVSIIHYTYGQDFDEKGRHTYGKVGPWHWDKRDYGSSYPDLPITRPVPQTPETVFRLIETVEEAGYSDMLWEWWRANMAQPKN